MQKWTFSGITRTYLGQLKRYFEYRYKLLRKPQIITIQGIRLFIGQVTDDRLLHSLYRGTYEFGESRCVQRKISKDDIVMEIGTGIGFISILCAKIIGDERVFTYEALPSLIPIIKINFALNKVSPSLMHAAVIDDDQEYVLFHQCEAFWESSMFPFKVASSSNRNLQAIKVPARNINAEIDRIKPSFLIMDVEGYEARLIRACNLTNIRKILIELHPNIIGDAETRSIRKFLTEMGFTVDPSVSDEHVIYLERL